MLDSGMESALNDQLNQEQTAAQEYLAMAAWFERLSLGGFARFMRRQCREETEHAMRLFDYILERGGDVRVGSVEQPRQSFESTRDVFEAAQQREQENTRSIHALYKAAADKNDYATQTMLQWFIDEQVEEEQWCAEALDLLEMVGDNPSALLMLDRRYGEKAAAD